MSQSRDADADHVRRQERADGATEDESDSGGDLSGEEKAESPPLETSDVARVCQVR